MLPPPDKHTNLVRPDPGVAAWERVPLGDLIRVEHGFAFKGSHFVDHGDELVLTPGNFTLGGGLRLRPGRDRFYIGPYPSKFRLSCGDMIVAMTDLTQAAPILGSPLMIPATGAYLHNQRLGKIKIIDDSLLDSGFAYYLFASDQIRAQLRGSATGATVKHTAPGRIYQAMTRLPPLTVQRKVAAVLSAYDDLIENNNLRIKILEEMAQRIYREWFVDFRYPGHEGVPLVDSQLGSIPAGWSVDALSDLCDRITDGAHASPPSTGEGMPMASVKDMTPRGIDLRTCRRISRPDYDALVRQDCRPLPNDVLVAKDGSYLKHVFVVRKPVAVVILSSIALLRPGGRIRPDVLALGLQQHETRQRLEACVSGVAIPRIVLKDFRKFRVVAPPKVLQDALIRMVQPCLMESGTLDEMNAALASARDLLLPRLVSGEIDVTDLDIAMPEAV